MTDEQKRVLSGAWEIVKVLKAYEAREQGEEGRPVTFHDPFKIACVMLAGPYATDAEIIAAYEMLK